ALLREALDALAVGQWLQERDQNRAVAQPSGLLDARLRDLDHRVCPPRIAEHGARLDERLVGEPRLRARAGLDDDLEAAQPRDGVGDECAPPLPLGGLLRNPDTHAADYLTRARPEAGASSRTC